MKAGRAKYIFIVTAKPFRDDIKNECKVRKFVIKQFVQCPIALSPVG